MWGVGEEGGLPGCHGRRRRGQGQGRQRRGVVWVREVVQRQLGHMLRPRRTLWLLGCGERLSGSSLPVLVTRHTLRAGRVELLRRGPGL